MDRRRQFFGLRFLVVVASFIVVVAGLRAAQDWLVPFLFAVFLTVLGMGPLLWLQRRRVPSVLAVIMVALLMVGIFVAVGTVLGSAGNEFTGKIPQYRVRLNEITVSLNDWLAGQGYEQSAAVLFGEINPASVLDMFGRALRGVVGTLSKTFLVLVLMIFMLIEGAAFRAKLRAAVGSVIDMGQFEAMTADVQRYLAIKTCTSGITGVLVGLWVSYFGLDFAVLWGLIAFLLNYIPFLGSFIAGIPAVLLALVELGVTDSLYVAAGYVAVNVAIGNFLEPILMGRRLNLSPLVVLLSLVFWGWVWGPSGALMSVPLTMIAKILLEHSREFRWIAILMDTRPPAPQAGSE